MDTIRSALSSATRVDGNTQAARPAVTPSGAAPLPAAAPRQNTAAATPATESSSGKAAVKDTREQLQALLDQVGERVQPDLRALSFRVSEEIGGVVVSVIDSQTDELIRQIPTETMVRLAERLEQINAESGAPGLLLNDQA